MLNPKGGYVNQWCNTIGAHVIKSVTITIGGGTMVRCTRCDTYYNPTPDQCTGYITQTDYTIIRENNDLFDVDILNLSDNDIENLLDTCGTYRVLLADRTNGTYLSQIPCTSTDFKQHEPPFEYIVYYDK
jgi:hypothetical protein